MGTVDERVLSHFLMTFERLDVKVFVNRNPVPCRWMRISGLYVNKLFQDAVPTENII
jgi:hypothetical protein